MPSSSISFLGPFLYSFFKHSTNIYLLKQGKGFIALPVAAPLEEWGAEHLMVTILNLECLGGLFGAKKVDGLLRAKFKPCVAIIKLAFPSSMGFCYWSLFKLQSKFLITLARFLVSSRERHTWAYVFYFRG